MKGFKVVLSVITAFTLCSCVADGVPDICGLYVGKRIPRYGQSGDFYVDIIRCNENGIAGETEYAYGNSYTVKSFNGSWSEDGDVISIGFRETGVLEKDGQNGDTVLYSYEASIQGGRLTGIYSNGQFVSGTIRLTRTDAEVTEE